MLYSGLVRGAVSGGTERGARLGIVSPLPLKECERVMTQPIIRNTGSHYLQSLRDILIKRLAFPPSEKVAVISRFRVAAINVQGFAPSCKSDAFRTKVEL